MKADAAGRIGASAAETNLDQLSRRLDPPWQRRIRSPLLVAWGSVIVAAVAVAVVLLQDERDDVATPVSAARPPENPPAPSPEEVAPPQLAHADELQPIDVSFAEDAPPAPPPVVAAPVDPADTAPIDVPLAPDIPRIDVAAQLRQPIREFTQDEPVAARRLLGQIAELAAVPIDFAALDEAELQQRLDRPVTVALKETTVGAILEAVTHQADMSIELAEGVIVLRPAAPQ